VPHTQHTNARTHAHAEHSACAALDWSVGVRGSRISRCACTGMCMSAHAAAAARLYILLFHALKHGLGPLATGFGGHLFVARRGPGTPTRTVGAVCGRAPPGGSLGWRLGDVLVGARVIGGRAYGRRAHRGHTLRGTRRGRARLILRCKHCIGGAPPVCLTAMRRVSQDSRMVVCCPDLRAA
jgi:hypothetical protein